MRAARRRTRETNLNNAENRRPVRGDNRTGQAIWRLGWWALAPNIAMGRDNRSHMKLVAEGCRTFKTAGDFFNLWGADLVRIFGTRAYRPAGRLPSRESDFSDRHRCDGGIKGANGRQFLRFRSIFAGPVRRLVWSLDSADTATGVVTSTTA